MEDQSLTDSSGSSLPSGVESRILELEQQIARLQTENRHLLKELDTARIQVGPRAHVFYEGNAAWEESNTRISGPFCPSCWNLHHKLIRPIWGHNRNGYEQVFLCSRHDPAVFFTVSKKLLNRQRSAVSQRAKAFSSAASGDATL